MSSAIKNKIHETQTKLDKTLQSLHPDIFKQEMDNGNSEFDDALHTEANENFPELYLKQEQSQDDTVKKQRDSDNVICSDCGKILANKQTLRKHVRRYHKLEVSQVQKEKRNAEENKK